MTYDWSPDPADLASIQEWLSAWEICVQQADFASARNLFANNVASFGTFMDIVNNREALEQNQWRKVWTAIDHFQWDFRTMRVGVSPDRLMAFLIATWTSTGYLTDQTSFSRPGRTTVILSRAAINDDWTGIHTHFSLNPGTPHRSHGMRRAES